MKLKDKYFLIFIFLAALVIRLAFVLPSNDIPSADAYVYDRLGLSIAHGNGYVDVNGDAHTFYPPFYPIFLSLIYILFGHSYAAVRIIQALMGAFGSVLIYWIGKRLSGRMTGVLASFVSIIYLPFIKSSGLLLTELIFTFILLLIVYYLIRIQEGDLYTNLIMLGLLIGIAVLTKSIMLFFPVFILPAFIYGKKDFVEPFALKIKAPSRAENNVHSPLGLKPWDFCEELKKYLIIILFFCMSMTPWIIRNYAVYHKFVPTSAQTGIGFYSSYCPAKGIFGVLASPDDPVVIEAGKLSSPILSSNYLVKKTFDFIVNNPKKVLILELKKILYFWAPFDWEVVGGRWFNFIYVVLLPFFALGLVLALKEFKRFYPVLAPIIYFQIMTLIFYGSPRFRLPAEPYMFILSIMGISVCWKQVLKNIISGSAL
jgi:hypothetical protein